MKFSAAGFAFPGMTVFGGEIGGLPTLVSDQLDDQTMVVLDAAQFAAASDAITLDSIRQGVIQLNDGSSSGSTAVSLFQNSLVAIRSERWFGFERLRETAVAVVVGSDY